MIEVRNRTNLKLLLQWTIAHLFSAGIPSLFILLVSILTQNGTLFFAMASLTLSSTGALTGIAQWIVLKRFSIGPKWILLSLIGWIIGLVIGQIIGAGLIVTIGGQKTLLIVFTSAGTGLGIMQWFVLRQLVFKSGLWVIANTIAWSVAGISWWQTTTPEGSFGIIGLTIASASAGILTGLVLTWLFQQPINNQNGNELSITSES